MPSSTPKGILKPDDTDAISTGALVARTAMDKIDDILPTGNRMRCGQFTGNTNAAGQVTINHGLGASPVVIYAQSIGAGGTAHNTIATFSGSTSFTASVKTMPAFAAVASTSVTIMWFAIS